ncbi:claudin-8-like [Aquarana catesbeiana]|uniref:claudin-8-like n=1 Tax=Aquarana catesbeiana TaxID=8400 RepID=UPI003CC92368
MICFLVHILGILSGAIGMILTWIVCFLPQWRLAVLAENNSFVVEGGRIDGEWLSRWDGLWVTCLSQRRFTLECNDYGSRVSLTSDLKAGRVFLGFSIAMTTLAFILSLIGIIVSGCCSRCCGESREDRRCLTLTAGIIYLLSMVLILIPVIWVIVNVARGAYDASLTRGAVRLEIGEAIMLAWPTIIFLLIGGIILCSSCCCGSGMVKKGQYRPACDQEMVQRKLPCDERSCSTPRMQYI